MYEAILDFPVPNRQHICGDLISVHISLQMKRLANHPSIFAWSGNNENEGALVDDWYGTSGGMYDRYKKDYVMLYIDTIRTEVLRYDDSRPFLPSSPTNGKLTQDKGWISESPKPSDPNYGDGESQ